MHLAELQQQFTGALFDAAQLPTAAHMVITQGNLSAEQRLGIYRNSVHGILTDYLSSLYPVVKHLVGDEFFAQVTDQYIDQKPPNSPYLAKYGANFAEFLSGLASLKQLRWISDIAKLEWARQVAWHTVNQAASDFTKISQLDKQQQNTLRFQLPHSAQIFTSPYAIYTVWLAHQMEEHPDKLPLEQIELHQATTVLVYRAKRRLYQYRLEALEAKFLHSIQQQKTLPELAETFQESLPNLLSNALQHGWILSFTV